MFRVNSKRNIGGHDSAGNVRHAAGHHGHQLRTSQVGQKWADRQRRFRLSHENAGSYVQRFGTACSHHTGHDPGKNLNNDLHDPEVIEHSEKSGDEDNGGQHSESEVSELRSRLGQVSKDEVGSGVRVTQQLRDAVSRFLKYNPPGVNSQNENCEYELQTEAPCHCFQTNGATIRGKNVGEPEHGQEAENSRESSHSAFL